MKKFIFIFILLVISHHVFAENRISLTLDKFISLVLKKNLNIKSYSLNKKISEFNIEQYISAFDPNFSLSIDKSYKKEFTGSALQSETSSYYISKNQNWDITIDKKFFSGTTAALSFSNNRYETNSNWSILNPAYSSQLQLSITQPILKGAGVIINKTDIIKAENRLKSTEYDIKNYINGVIIDACYKYFDLLYAYENYKVREESLNLARDILKIDRKKLQVGLTSKDIIKQSEAEVAARKEDVINAYQELMNLSDELKKYYNDILKDYIIKPDYQVKITPVKLSLKKAIETGLKNRYELKEIEQEIKNADLDIKKAKNDLLPELNLNIYAGLSGKGEDYPKDIDRLKGSKYREWGIGLEFKYPFGNRLAKSSYKIAAITKEQLIFQKKELENKIILEIKRSYRNLKTLMKKIEANKKSFEAAAVKLEIEEKKYKHGLSTPFEVFSYQNDYIQEKLKLLNSQISYIKESLNFSRLIGKDLFIAK